MSVVGQYKKTAKIMTEAAHELNRASDRIIELENTFKELLQMYKSQGMDNAYNLLSIKMSKLKIH